MLVRPSRPRRRTVALVAASAVAVVATALTPLSSTATPAPVGPARPFVSGGQTIPAYDYDNAIRERVAVEVPLDSDHDGSNDRVMVDLIRPGEAAQAGVDVPVIIQASPYYARNPASYFGADGTRQVFNTWLDNYFVPRGYAVAFVDLIGTFRSSGCDDVGGDYEVAGGKAVIDWLNGRTNGYAADGQAVTADWSTGKAGMIGVSWNGTIANAVAGTGVEGLETIVPIAAISSWYDYTRGFGVPFYGKYVDFLHDYVSNDVSPRCPELRKELETASDSATGSYSPWWDPRNYRLDAQNVHASVYVVHGLNDENVKTRHFGEWWDELARNGVPRKVFLHRDVHIDSFAYRDLWVQRLHPWFDHWLQGLDNGAMGTPMATVQREDGSFTSEATWPVAGVQQNRFFLAALTDRRAGTLTTEPAADTGTVKVTDWGESDDDYVVDPTDRRSDRAVFLTAALDQAVRLSGTGTVTVRVQSDRPAAAIKARLVDYGPATRYSSYVNLATRTCWGDGNSLDTGCYPDTSIATKRSDLDVVARTIANIGHHRSLDRLETLRPGVWYDLTFELNADDAVFAAGHRIGLVLTVEQSNPDSEVERMTLTVDPAGSSLVLPLAGGTSGLASPGPAESVTARVKSQPEPAKDPAELMRQFVDASR